MTTLTKIDPSILKPKPAAVSQHAARNGTRVTATINPLVHFPPPVDPIVFNFDPESIDENPIAYCGEEDRTGGYYVSRVCNVTRRFFFKADPDKDNPLLLWRDERDLFLKEFVRLEGRGVSTNGNCELCRNEGAFRCLDCVAVQFLCQECIARVHAFNPFHVIQVSLDVLLGLFSVVLTHSWG